MEVAVILAITTGYLAAGLGVSRFIYAKVRPFREPLSCKYSYHRDRDHHVECYRRMKDGPKTEESALNAALTGGLLWPMTLLMTGCYYLGTGARHAITGGIKPTLAELEAESARLGREEEERARAEDRARRQAQFEAGDTQGSPRKQRPSIYMTRHYG